MTVDQYQIIINVLVWAIVAGGGLFLVVIGWIGKQLHTQLMSLNANLVKTNESLALIEKDLRGDLSKLDRRVTILEVASNKEKARGNI